MSVLQTVLVAIRALLRNKMRSFLTTLGVIIGVGAVVAMTAIGAGARARVQETFESMGSNMLVVHSGSHRHGGARGGAGSGPSITWDDLEAIRTELPSVRYAAPLLGTASQLLADGQNWNSQVQGTTPDYFAIRNYDLGRGRFFDARDVMMGAKVAVLGQTVVDNLFGPWTDPVGRLVRVGQVPFEVVGVFAPKGQAGFGGDQDDVVFVPVSTFRAKLQGGLQQFVPGAIFVGAVSQEATSVAQTRIETLLRARHRLRPGAADDFTVRNLADMAAAREEGTKTLTALLAGIALVSLIVGGIGIMNIMLVSVTERTREIGLRMAVGARPRDILTQFMVEAVTLSVVGGALGVGFGLGSAALLTSRFDWPMLIQPEIIALALVFSGLVGIGFGLYPAYKASRLDPIQALRFE